MKMLYAIFVLPFARLFAWFKMKWEWRGFATVTGEDFQKTGNEKKFRRDLQESRILKQISKDMYDVLWPDKHPPYLCETSRKLNSIPLEEVQEILRKSLGMNKVTFSKFMKEMERRAYPPLFKRVGNGDDS